jgi:hypothetical protein
MNKKNGNPYHGMITSDGSASLSYIFSDPKIAEKLTDEEKVHILSKVLSNLSKVMLDKGYIRLQSVSDLSATYGKSRQYWEKLLTSGKIPYHQTAAGKITLNLWVEGYLSGEEYPVHALLARKAIIKKFKENGKSTGIIACPRCKSETLRYHYNQGQHINGLCQNCHFHLDTQE